MLMLERANAGVGFEELRAEGLDCPAAAALCVCGARGCPDETQHRNGFLGPIKAYDRKHRKINRRRRM